MPGAVTTGPAAPGGGEGAGEVLMVPGAGALGSDWKTTFSVVAFESAVGSFVAPGAGCIIVVGAGAGAAFPVPGGEESGAPTGISQRWLGCPCGGFIGSFADAGCVAVIAPVVGFGAIWISVPGDTVLLTGSDVAGTVVEGCDPSLTISWAGVTAAGSSVFLLSLQEYSKLTAIMSVRAKVFFII